MYRRLSSFSPNFLLHYRQLLNIYAVDAIAKIEMDKLLFLKLNQRELRGDKYIHFKDLMLNDSVQESGEKVILLYSMQELNFELHIE